MHAQDGTRPGKGWGGRRLLAPLAFGYAAASALHRALFLRPRETRSGRIPLVVLGSLRAGGAGKTAVAIALARALSERGIRAGVLAYWLNRPRGTRGLLRAVAPGDDWRAASDEAVLLARRTGVPVFVTRDRDAARTLLSDETPRRFDLLLSDDGLMDPRLGDDDVLRVALVRDGERPGLADLLPAGPYRLTAAALDRVDVILRPGDAARDHDSRTATYHRRLLPPPGWPGTQADWLLCGIGDPEAFADALRRAGGRIAGMSRGPDHGLPGLRRAAQRAARQGATRFACTEKDAVKLETHPDCPGNLLVFGEAVELPSGFTDRVAAMAGRCSS